MPRHAKKWWQGMIRAGTKAWSGLVPRHDLYFCHGLNRTSAKSTFFKACSLFRTCAWAWWGQKWQKHDQDWCQGIIRIYCSAYCLGRHAHWSMLHVAKTCCVQWSGLIPIHDYHVDVLVPDGAAWQGNAENRHGRHEGGPLAFHYYIYTHSCIVASVII